MLFNTFSIMLPLLPKIPEEQKDNDSLFAFECDNFCCGKIASFSNALST